MSSQNAPYITMPDGEIVPCSKLISISEASRKCGMSRPALQKWCKGEGGRLKSVEIAGRPMTTKVWLDDAMSSKDVILTAALRQQQTEIEQLKSELNRAIQALNGRVPTQK